MAGAIIAEPKDAPMFKEPEGLENRVGLTRDGVSAEASAPSTSVT